MSDKTIEQRALDLLEKLLKAGAWYGSAIELHQYHPDYADGKDLEIEALSIMKAAGREIPE